MKRLKSIALCMVLLAVILTPINYILKKESSNDIFLFILKRGLASHQNANNNDVNKMQDIFSFGKFFISKALPNTENKKEHIANNSLDYSFSGINDKKYHDGHPTVLIYHTHTTESYLEDINIEIYRNTDSEKNMVLIGSIISKILYEEYGIEVIHITDTFDIPYDGAYQRSAEAISNCLASYPDIIYSFDIHRDGLSPSEDNLQVYKTNVSGVECAKIMIVLGVQSETTPTNAEFAAKVASSMENLYPGLFKKTLDRNYVYNQNMAPKALLFEVGSNLSTQQEAKNSAVFLARVLGESILEDMNHI